MIRCHFESQFYIRCIEIKYVILFGNGLFRGTSWSLNRLELSNLHKSKMLSLLLNHHRDGGIHFEQYILQTCLTLSGIFFPSGQ